MAPAARPTLVIGMHRSGTSVTAGVIRALGVDFGGAADMTAAHALDNPAGYHEREAIRVLNVEILRALGGSWWQPPALPAGWHTSPALAALRARAGDLIAAMSVGTRWGIKDPAMSLTLPFWTALTGPADVVVCLRDPAEVAASLLRRYHVTQPDGAARILTARDWGGLWAQYTRRALSDARGQRLLVHSYAALMRDPAPQVARLQAFLGLGADPSAHTRAAGLIRADLWRERAGALYTGPGATPGITIGARWRHRRLLSAAGRGPSAAPAAAPRPA
jgi:hypothetical protein